MSAPKSAPNQCKCLVTPWSEKDNLASQGIPKGVYVDFGVSADAGVNEIHDVAGFPSSSHPQVILKNSAQFGPNIVTCLTKTSFYFLWLVQVI